MKLLIIGPQPEPITGNSLSNKIVYEYLPQYSNVQTDVINTSYKVLKEDLGVFSLEKAFHYIKQYKSLWKIRENDKVYITTGQTFFGVLKYFPYFFLAKILNKEIIIHIHGNHLWKEYKSLTGIKKSIFYKILSMADKGIVLSFSLKKNLTPFIDEKYIYILENFVEDFLFVNPIPKKFDKIRIIYLSNLMKEKGILDLLKALEILQNNNVEYEAKIAGGIDSVLQPTLEHYWGKLHNIEYLGTVYGQEKKELLEWGNVFVFPTYYAMEGQPISIFEAMATGNIVITTPHAGIPDVFLEEKNGFYIDKKSPDSIATKLTELQESLEQHKVISENNKEEAKEKYRVSSFTKKLHSILVD